MIPETKYLSSNFQIINSKILEAIKECSQKDPYLGLFTKAKISAATSFEEALEIRGWKYKGDQLIGLNKNQDDDALFAAIAPYVHSGSYIEMKNYEDDPETHFRWYFINGTVKEIYPSITWPDMDEPMGPKNH